MVDGILEMIPGAQVWHLGIYRDEQTLRPISYYNKLPIEPTVQVCLILDPMLATGGSATAAIDVLKNWGVKRIKFVGLIAAPEGIEVVTTSPPRYSAVSGGGGRSPERARLYCAGPG